jgi:hypothetical protein
MADDFVGVPARRWYDLERQVSFAGTMLVLLAIGFYILIARLIAKGVLSGWADLLDNPASA